MFAFTKNNQKLVEKHLAKYPADHSQSALLPVLDIAQRQNGGWLSFEALEAVAKVLNVSVLKVHEVASFYTMFHLEPVGMYHIQICGTTPCWLRGAEDLREACKKHLSIGLKEVTADGLFSLEEVECLGACVNAPVVQINDTYFEDLDHNSVIELIEKCRTENQIKKGQTPEPYSAIGRQASAPLSTSFLPTIQTSSEEDC